MTNSKYLFITCSDLADTDSNGRTLRDVFSYVEDECIYSFCTSRRNKSISSDKTFLIDESDIFKPLLLLKKIHSEPIEPSSTRLKRTKTRKKNPLTCFARNLVWSIIFRFFKRKLKNWILSIKPDFIIFDPADFIFMHKIAYYISSVSDKPLILYNTEDFYFKTWNYMHDENGFRFLYPLFRKRLQAAYRKTFRRTRICFHNVEGLKTLYAKEFPSVEHCVVYHPSTLVSEREANTGSDCMDFYYCGCLDKGRDETMVLLAKAILQISPVSKIYFNGKPCRNFDTKFIDEIGNVVNLGFTTYQNVQKMLKKNLILISVASLEAYNSIDKYHAFSTKLSDYISSLNPIIHIGPIGDEYLILQKYDLAYVCDNAASICGMVKKLFSDLRNLNYDKITSQKNFYEQFLNPIKVASFIQNKIEGHV